MSRKIKVMYDREADVLAIIFDEDSKDHDFIEPTPGWFMWFDENNNARIIEIFRASRFLSKLRTTELEDQKKIYCETPHYAHHIFLRHPEVRFDKDGCVKKLDEYYFDNTTH